MEKEKIFKNTVLVIGLPQHITIACCREHVNSVIFEYFDPAGPCGDLKSIKAVKQWVNQYLTKIYSCSREKKVIFKDSTKNVCFQSDKSDVMCQTWIWYWVYWRMVRQADEIEIIKHCKKLIREKNSLTHINKFHKWMSELYKLGYFIRENSSEASSAERGGPPSYEKLLELRRLRIIRKIREMDDNAVDTLNKDIDKLTMSTSQEKVVEEIDDDMMIDFRM